MKKGNLLTGNVVFIILNLVFISILLLFIFTKAGPEARLEEKYAKEIALMIDGLDPVSVVTLDMSEVLSYTEENQKDTLISITENMVTVTLREKGGYSYSFFNDVQARAFKDKGENYTITIFPKEQ